MTNLPFAPLTLHELNDRVDFHRANVGGRASSVVRQDGSIANLTDLDVAYIDTNARAADMYHRAAMTRINGERGRS